jgi:SAM-dependent methyltransferase
MSGQIIDLQSWFETPPGRHLLAWEQAQFDHAVADVFGYHAIQLGIGGVDGLRNNRMPHRWFAEAHGRPCTGQAAAVLAGFDALPFPAASLDLVVLPHTLELGQDPHATLREVERVLVPEGRVVLCGFNPVSLWGLRQRRAHLYRRLGFGEAFLPEAGEFIGYWRLRDWLRLLGFEVESGRFGIYRPAFRTDAWLERSRWLDAAGERWWPILGAVYFLVAVKRVRGLRLLGADWRRAPKRVGASLPVVGRAHRPAHEAKRADIDIRQERGSDI